MTFGGLGRALQKREDLLHLVLKGSVYGDHQQVVIGSATRRNGFGRHVPLRIKIGEGVFDENIEQIGG